MAAKKNLKNKTGSISLVPYLIAFIVTASVVAAAMVTENFDIRGRAASPKNAVFTFVLRNKSMQGLVEQQTPGGAMQADQSLWVINPYAAGRTNLCSWDIDDTIEHYGSGEIKPGESVEFKDCTISDKSGHFHVFSLDARGSKNDQFKLELLYDDGLTSYTLAKPSKMINNSTIARMCGTGVDYGTQFADRTQYLIEGSNGGIGRKAAVTYRLTNTGTRSIRTATLSVKRDPDYGQFNRPRNCGALEFENCVRNSENQASYCYNTIWD